MGSHPLLTAAVNNGKERPMSNVTDLNQNDAFAARRFGFQSVADYREWVQLDGKALCSACTPWGPCRNRTSDQLSPQEWLQRHRKQPCLSHALKMRSRSA
jgi:hypothetical protein